MRDVRHHAPRPPAGGGPPLPGTALVDGPMGATDTRPIPCAGTIKRNGGVLAVLPKDRM